MSLDNSDVRVKARVQCGVGQFRPRDCIPTLVIYTQTFGGLVNQNVTKRGGARKRNLLPNPFIFFFTAYRSKVVPCPRAAIPSWFANRLDRNRPNTPRVADYLLCDRDSETRNAVCAHLTQPVTWARKRGTPAKRKCGKCAAHVNA